MPASNSKRRGFVLIELMAALALSGVAIMSIGLVIRQIGVTHDALARIATHEDAAANGARLLRDLVARTDFASDTARQFFGDHQSASMPTWCDTPGGWLEPCVVRVVLDERKDSTAVQLMFEDDAQLEVAEFTGTVTLAYFGSVAGGDRWLAVWGRGVVPPRAIGLIHQLTDTIVLPVGGRN